MLGEVSKDQPQKNGRFSCSMPILLESVWEGWHHQKERLCGSARNRAYCHLYTRESSLHSAAHVYKVICFHHPHRQLVLTSLSSVSFLFILSSCVCRLLATLKPFMRQCILRSFPFSLKSSFFFFPLNFVRCIKMVSYFVFLLHWFGTCLHLLIPHDSLRF